MRDLSEDGRRTLNEIAGRYGVGIDAVEHLLRAVIAGHGNQAQFSHPDLGGMGQWSRGGMTMIGDMFNNALKARVDSLATELSGLLASGDGLLAPAPRPSQSQSQSNSSAGNRFHNAPAGENLFVPGSGSRSQWWPEGLGEPASTGAQNDMRYAFFPHTRRLAIDQGGSVTVYDTADHQIGGFSQAQGGSQSLRFDSQHGPVRLEDLDVIGHPQDDADDDAPRPAAAKAPDETRRPRDAAAPHADDPAGPAQSTSAAPAEEADIFQKVERLAALHAKGILTDREYETKKAELLARL